MPDLVTKENKLTSEMFRYNDLVQNAATDQIDLWEAIDSTGINIPEKSRIDMIFWEIFHIKDMENTVKVFSDEIMKKLKEKYS